MPALNDTHDPARRSWLEEANAAGSEFPIQNLPFGVFRRENSAPRGGVAIGAHVLDLKAAHDAGLFSGAAAEAARAASGETLNALLAQDADAVSALRARLSDLLRVGGRDSAAVAAKRDGLLFPLASVELCMPVTIGAYTDFSCSYTHMGGMRGGQPAPVFFHLPIAYNGRASSLRTSGSPLIRPSGQWAAKPPDQDICFGPEPRLDFELEFGAFVGHGNELGSPLTLDEAADGIFGCCLLNDWSARGMQIFESLLGRSWARAFSRRFPHGS